jgi:hypothetical protein
MFQSCRLVVGCGLIWACGAEPPPAKAPAPELTLAPAAAPAPSRQPSAEVSRYWLLSEQQPFSLYADLTSLLKSELVASLAPAVLEQAGDVLKPAERACVSALLQHAKELLVGGGERSGLIVLSLGADGVKAARSACVGSLLPVEQTALRGAEEAYAVGDDVIFVMPGVVVYGTKPLVEAALDAAAKPAPVLAHFALKGDEQLSLRFDLPREGVSATGSVSTSSQQFLLAAQVLLPSDAAAEAVDQKLSLGRSQAKALVQSVSSDAMLGKFLDSVQIERHGRRFNVRFELRGSPVEQARQLGAITALGLQGARKYMLEAKAVEAKRTIAQIAKRYQESLVADEPAKAKKPKKLSSLPAVPASVPRATKYQSLAEDWKAWSAIQFKLEAPQAYQYEVVAAKDGKTADVLARGDLDGDGVTSLYRLKIQLDAKTGQITAQEFDETEPLE